MDIEQTEFLFLPQQMFFTRHFLLPDGLSDGDIRSYALTMLENVSPFEEDTLRWGYVANKKRGEGIVYGACADRLLTLRKVSEYIDIAEYAMPLCALLFQLEIPNGISVFKRSDGNSKCEYVAVKVESGKWSDVFAAEFDKDLENLDALKNFTGLFNLENADISLYECGFAKNVFGAVFVEAKKIGTCKISENASACDYSTESSQAEVLRGKCLGKTFFENADIRSAAEVSKVHIDATKNRACKIAVYAALALLVLLVLWNISFIFQQMSLTSLKEKYASLETESKEVAKIRDNSIFIGSLLSKKMHNTMMLARVNKYRPQGILFLKSSATGPLTMEIHGSSPSVSQINVFDRALNSSGEFKSVKFKTSGVSGAGAMWTLNVEFKK